MARELGAFCKETYLALDPDVQKEFSQAMGVRALKNIMLEYDGTSRRCICYLNWHISNIKLTGNMSERLGALQVLVWNDAPQAEAALRRFLYTF